MSRRGRPETISPLGRAPARRPPQRPGPAPAGGRGGEPPRKASLGRRLRGVFTENLGFKFLALLLAATLFLLVNTERDREITARLGVSYTLPEGKVLVSERIDEVRITVRGPWRRLRRFDEREVDRINLDLTGAVAGAVAITGDQIKLPPGLTLTSWSPRSVPVAFEPEVERAVPIGPVVVGRPAHGYLVAEINATPTEAWLRGATGQLGALASIPTSEIHVDGRSESFTAEVDLRPPDGTTLIEPAAATLSVRLAEQLETRRLGSLPVTVVGDVEDLDLVSVTPPQVEVVLSGSVRAIERAVAAGARPVARATAIAPGRRREVVVTVEGLPAGVGVEIVPARVLVEVRK
ncbi:MAG: CdaR family protein [Kofleriaceae bacterium]